MALSRGIVGIGVFALLIVAMLGLFDRIHKRKIRIGNKEVSVEVADSAEKTAQGFQGRCPNKNEGMLFVFDGVPEYRQFHMKNVPCGLDIAFVKYGIIEKIVTAEPEQDNIHSTVPADHVIEMPSGWFSANGIGIGTKVSL